MLEFIKQYFTSVLGALSILSIVYLIFWVLFGRKLSNRKIQLSKRAGWPQIKGEIGATLVSFIGSTLLMLLLLSFKDNGLAKFYNEAGKYGIWYEVLTVCILVLASDTWFYWSHRIMHHPSIYKYVHALHHKSLDVNPFTSTSFHVIEAVWLTLFVIPIVFVMPVSMTALGIVQVLGTLNNLKSHLGYELFPGFFSKMPPFNMLVTATNHSLHHTQYNGNYGLFFRFWDILCSTELNTTTATFDEIHDRENETIIDNSKYRILTIDKLVKENAETVSIYFKPTDKDFYNYKPGQYLTLRVKVNGQVHERCFSLSSSPKIDDFLRITVKLKGQVSHYFYNEAKAGDTIQSLLPVGDFIVHTNEKIDKHYVMIAGGSGITPLYSMIRQVLKFEPQSKVTLLYANSSEQSVTFKEELDQLVKQYPQFVYKNFISGKSRISKEDLTPHLNASFYICGPDKLKEGMIASLNELKISKSNINVEHFADGYVPWFGLLQNKSMAISKRAAVFMVVIFIYCTTAFGQTEFIGGSWKDKAHPEKVVTFLKSDNNIIGKDSKNKVIFKSIKLLKNNQYQGILINPDDNEEFKVTITLSSKNEFKFKVKKFIFSKEFTFVRN
jgi:ring-1,2-phenylacetyl-CoA epoxidase subunit PaaE